jgi:hypothetical protein
MCLETQEKPSPEKVADAALRLITTNKSQQLSSLAQAAKRESESCFDSALNGITMMLMNGNAGKQAHEERVKELLNDGAYCASVAKELGKRAEIG